MGGEGGVVAAAVFRMEHQSQVQNPGFQFRIAVVNPQHMQNIFRRRKLRPGGVDKEAVVLRVHVMSIGLIAVHRQLREQCDHFQALPQGVGDGGIRCLFIVRVQSQDAAGQGVHHVGGRRFHHHVPDKIGGKGAVFGQELFKFLAFRLVRQGTEQQQVNGFLKAKPLFPNKAPGQFFNVDSPVVQFPFTGNRFAVYFLAGNNV